MKLSAAAKMKHLYVDRHLNIFVPYESHDLDYNVTRALICTLKWSEPALVRSFLKEVVGVEVGDTSVLYDLQACDYDEYDPEQCDTRKILGISRGGEIATRLPAVDHIYQPRVLSLLRGAQDASQKLAGLKDVVGNNELTTDDVEVLTHTLEEYERGSMPDGWIFTSDGKACVLIEAKLTRFLDQHQLDRHAETWYGEVRRGDDQVIISWEAVANFMKKNGKLQEGRTGFLCRQLFEYLELLGQAPFESFKPYDLDGDALLESLPKVQRLAREVIAKAQEAGMALSTRVVPRGPGLRIFFGDNTLLGALGIELAEDEVIFSYTIGEPIANNKQVGPEAGDQLLANTSNGLHNSLEEVTLDGSGYKVRVDRLVRDGMRLNIDRTLFNADFVCRDFSEVLDCFATQHPNYEVRQKQGRSGLIAWTKSFQEEEALMGGEALLKEAVRAFHDFSILARTLSYKEQAEDESVPDNESDE